MLSLEYIREENMKAAHRAAHDGKHPFIFEAGEVNQDNLIRLPYIGDYVPKGWQEVEDEDGNCLTLFVDSSGFGREDEPAWTVRRLLRFIEQHLEDHYGYAVVSTGQFQVYLGVFRKL